MPVIYVCNYELPIAMITELWYEKLYYHTNYLFCLDCWAYITTLFIMLKNQVFSIGFSHLKLVLKCGERKSSRRLKRAGKCCGAAPHKKPISVFVQKLMLTLDTRYYEHSVQFRLGGKLLGEITFISE